MKSTIVKNLKLRLNFSKAEVKLNVQKFLSTNLLNSCTPSQGFGALLYLQKPKSSTRSKLQSNCLLTGRTKGVNNRYGISRLKLRSLLQLGIIPGYKKAAW
jgi:ribosomal protein S14